MDTCPGAESAEPAAVKTVRSLEGWVGGLLLCGLLICRFLFYGFVDLGMWGFGFLDYWII